MNEQELPEETEECAVCPHDDVEWVYEVHPVCRKCGQNLMAEELDPQ